MADATRRDILAITAGAAMMGHATKANAATGAGVATPIAPILTPVFSAHITLAAPIESGRIDGKRKRFIAITGGTVSGPMLSGEVLPGGGDWQSIHDDGLVELDARYTLKSNDGTIIGISNPGIRVASPEITKRLAAGEDVDPSLYYFRTTPRFDVVDGPYAWLRRSIFIGYGIRKPDHVIVEFFQLG